MSPGAGTCFHVSWVNSWAQNGWAMWRVCIWLLKTCASSASRPLSRLLAAFVDSLLCLRSCAGRLAGDVRAVGVTPRRGGVKAALEVARPRTEAPRLQVSGDVRGLEPVLLGHCFPRVEARDAAQCPTGLSAVPSPSSCSVGVAQALGTGGGAA